MNTHRRCLRQRLRRRGAAFTAAAVVAGLALTGCTPPGLEDLPAPAGTDGPTYHITVEFSDVSNLSDGADVKLGGVVIGQVGSITTHDYRAAVGLSIEKKFALGRDASLQVRFTTPLGDDYVSVQSAGHPDRGALADGAVVPVSQTATAPGIEDTFAALSTLLNGGGLDKLHTIATQLDVALHGSTGSARRVLENLQKVVRNLDTHKADIDSVLDGLDSLTSTLNNDTKTITNALALFPPTLQTLAGDTARIRVLLAKVGKLGTTVTSLLARGQSSLLTDLDNLQPTLNALRQRDGELIPTMQALTKLGTSFRRAAPGDYLNISGTIQFLLNAPPAKPKPGGSTGTGTGAGSGQASGAAAAVQQLATMGGAR